jgi:hypothetical protein
MEAIMKRIMVATTCILALSTAGAFAQAGQPAPGAAGQGDVGPSPRGPGTKGMTTGRASNMQNGSNGKGMQPPSAGGSNTNNTGSRTGGSSGSGK